MSHGVDGVQWHLVAPNGRVIARSTRPAADEPSAMLALSAVCQLAAAHALTPQLRHPRSSVSWTWTAVTATGDAVAQCHRVYERYGTCLSAYQRFVRVAGIWDAAGEGLLCSATDVRAGSAPKLADDVQP